MTTALDKQGRRRVVIEGVEPKIDCGRFPIKRTHGQKVVVEADVFADGHDLLSGLLLFRHETAKEWQEIPLTFLNNDRWRAEFGLDQLGRYHYTVEAWVDHFKTWQYDFKKRTDAQQDVSVDLQIGAKLIEEAARRAKGEDTQRLKQWRDILLSREALSRLGGGGAEQLGELMAKYPDRQFATIYEPYLTVVVDRERARFSSWYEMFPRSSGDKPGAHGTFADCTARLPYVAAMGFDVLYLPPIHPVGRSFRKGKNNSVTAQPGEPGSPWAIGAAEGGHKAIHPELGTLADFKKLIAKAEEFGIDIALDIAFQCAPEHPYVKDHPNWFRARPDGTIQYAENPPKKYQDIYPFDFESEDWRGLWQELRDVMLYWIEQGVHIFRVDNPHTKAFPFWQWAIGEIKTKHPEIIFLSEAFTRPKVMYRLAKIGFSQSYTYFTWRNHRAEFIEYFTELTKPPVQDFFRPNLWPNTPDILPEHLQTGGRAAFMARLALAATLGASYGIYGPAFELCEHLPREHNSEEYLDSEKYEIRQWDLKRPDSLREFITKVNQARRLNPALQANLNLQFHDAGNDQLLCYTKRSAETGNLVLAVVNLDFYRQQNGYPVLPLEQLGISPDRPYQVHDLLGGGVFTWTGPKNYVQLDPATTPAHIFQVRQD